MTDELLRAFEKHIQSVTLEPSKGGVFDVRVDGRLLFSKTRKGRHADPGEIYALVQEYLLERSEPSS